MPGWLVPLLRLDLLTKTNAKITFAPCRLDTEVPLEKACAMQSALLTLTEKEILAEISKRF